MSEIKAIQTTYKGYRFRSRLEARWAVFLDKMEIEYEYERQGYETDAGWYLPDFWIPSWNAHLEIKPLGLTFEGWAKCHALDSNATPVIAVCGNPWPREYGVQRAWHEEFNPNCQGDGFITCSSGSCDAFGWMEMDIDVSFYFLTEHDQTCILKHGKYLSVMMDNNPFNPLMLDAFKCARQARFEHGETPVL